MSDNGALFVAEVDKYRAGAIRIATREIGSFEAEDVVQDALVQAWQSRDTFDPQRGSLKSWFFTIVDNKCRDHKRRSNGRGSTPAPVFVSLDDPDFNLMNTLSEEDDDVLGIDWESAWGNLSPRQRDVMTLFLDGMSAKEIAKDLGISPTAVRGYKHRAILRVRERFVEETYG